MQTNLQYESQKLIDKTKQHKKAKDFLLTEWKEILTEV